MKKGIKHISYLICFIGLLLFHGIQAEASSLPDNPNITFSPDGKAFTTNAGDTNYTWYPNGETAYTGITSSIRELEEGEHKYKSTRNGIVPVGYWKVVHATGQCIHDAYPSGYYHGINYETSKCFRQYNSGWFAYCADCGDLIAHLLFYMNKTTAYTVKDLDMNLDYYYLCPYDGCRNLEQGAELGKHECDAISWNRYYVFYNKNGGNGQTMQRSLHMYNNKTIYEGESAYASTRLSKNTYTRIGYEFIGWNTKQDGSGEWFSDSQEIPNLTTENEVTIFLYAQWKKSESTLNINPNGGSYLGSTGITSVTQDYNSTYLADSSKITPPAGYTVTFDSCEGNPVSPILQTRTFSEWQLSASFHGKLVGNTYTYLGRGGMQDTITAIYSYNSINLPSATRSGYSFGGWYYDASCTKFAGKAGGTITPAGNFTLYAKWVGLLLVSEDNYSGKGAVNLSWNQNDGNNKAYYLYQSLDASNWTKIAGATDIAETFSVSQSYSYTGNSSTYTVPYTGLYSFTAYGAQGGNASNGKAGGKGGSVTGNVWLTKGDVITIIVGGQNGYNGGGSATYSSYGNGGGYTILSSSQKGTLLIAGGGGGATTLAVGFPGGSTASTISGRNGQSGAAGGGGGNTGGNSGSVSVHGHDTNCYHYHSGNSTSGGGCYTIAKTKTLTCNYSVTINGTAGWNCGAGGCSGWTTGVTRGVSHSSNKCNGSPSGTWYTETCSKCNHYYRTGTEVSAGSHTYPETYYDLGCGKSEGLQCNMTAGQVLSSSPAYGGSNYVNTSYVVSYTSSQDARTGNGAASIVSSNIGYHTDQLLNNVSSPDKAAPNPVNPATVVKQALSDIQVKVSWSAPADNGTKYYHMAKSFVSGSLQEISTSNITENTLTSKVDGYYYIVNTSPGTTVTASATKITAAAITINLTADLQYLHVACIDKAGNLSSTTHITIGKTDPEVAWNIFTEQIRISEQGSVHSSGIANTYYVRCNEETPFTLSFHSWMQGNAREIYQITNSIFESQPGNGEAARMDVYTKPEDNITNDVTETKAARLDKTISGNLVLCDAAYTITKRYNWCKDLDIIQKFTLQGDMDGIKIRVTPIAGADSTNGTVYSDKTKDLANSIYLIGDSTPPDIHGLDALKNIDTIDRDNENCTIVLQVSDSGSGVDEFYAEVTNTDNYITETLYSEDGSTLTLNLSENSALFTGDFTVEIHAVDNVGNERIETHGLSEFTLSADIQRILEPHDPIFRTGESGLLTIVTTGYADRVEVIFPEEMTALNPGLNTVYEYSPATYMEEEELTFMIPLYTPELDDYKIIVRAYKDGTKLEEYPRFSTIGMDGSVLDSLRKQLH